MNTVELSIVVPCFNEEESLPELVRRSVAMGHQHEPGRFEVLLIDDGSTDSTWDTMRELRKSHPELVPVKLSRNHGHQLALTAGLSLVSGDRILVIDADLQDPPELYPDMRAMMEQEKADVVFGQRLKRSGEGFVKKVTAAVFYRLLRKNTDINLPIDAGDFRLMSRRVCDLIVAMPERDRFVRGLVAWVGFKQVPFTYERDARFAGETKYPMRKMIRLAANAFMGFSMLPLRFAARMAGFMILVMFAFLGYAIYSFLFLQTIQGWTSLAIMISFVSAIQLAMLSIIGEYIGLIYLEGKRRPLFIIESVERE